MQALKFLALVAVTVLHVACAVKPYYSSEDVNSKLGDAATQMSGYVGQAEQDYQTKNSLISDLGGTGADLKKDPYPLLKVTLDQMRALLTPLEEERTQLDAKMQELRAAMGDRKKILEGEPGYDQVERLQVELPEFKMRLEEKGRKYQESSADFAGHAQRAKIARVNVAELRAKVAEGVTRIQQLATSARAEHDNAKARSSGLDKKERRKNDAVVRGMAAYLKQIQGQETLLNKSLTAFEKEMSTRFADKTELVLGPPLQAHGILFRLETIENDVRYFSKRVSALAAPGAPAGPSAVSFSPVETASPAQPAAPAPAPAKSAPAANSTAPAKPAPAAKQ